MLRESLKSSKFIVAWHQSEELRRLTAEKAQELLDFEPVWILVAAQLADGVLVMGSDEEAIELRKVLKVSAILRAKLRELAQAVDEQSEPQ